MLSQEKTQEIYAASVESAAEGVRLGEKPSQFCSGMATAYGHVLGKSMTDVAKDIEAEILSKGYHTLKIK